MKTKVTRTQIFGGLFSTDSHWARWVLAIIVFTYLICDHLGYIDPLKNTLNSDAFLIKLGTYQVTAYKLISGLISLLMVFWIASLISVFGEKRIRSLKHIRASNRTLFVNGFKLIIFVSVFFMGLNILGINPTVLTVFGGALGIGIGFGLQKIASNFISGLILLFEKSVEEGDMVELAGGFQGFVRRTGARYTLIETFDSKEIMIPNEDFITNRVTNWTFSNTIGRVEIIVGVSYDSDIELARTLILDTAKEHPRCSIDPAPQCYLTEYAASSVNFLLYFWVDDVTLGRIEPKSDVLRSIWKKFKTHNIIIPYPQTDIHIKDAGLTKGEPK